MHYSKKNMKRNIFTRWLHFSSDQDTDTSTFPKGTLLDEKFLSSRKKNFMRNISGWQPDDNEF